MNGKCYVLKFRRNLGLRAGEIYEVLIKLLRNFILLFLEFCRLINYFKSNIIRDFHPPKKKFNYVVEELKVGGHKVCFRKEVVLEDKVCVIL